MNSRTQITVSWMAPADNGGSAVIGYTLARKYGDMMDFETIAATNAASWWNTLDCPMMNDAVEDHVMDGDPAVGPDDMTSPYCALYAGLSDAAEAVVDRAFAASGYDAITGMEYMDEGLMMATTYMYQVKAVNAAGASMPSEAATGMTNANMAPTASSDIADVETTDDMMPGAMDLSMYFSDADGDTLSYEAESDNEAVATASVEGNMLTINIMGVGEANITVTASDMYGGSVMQSFMVTVEASNMPPMAQPDLTASVKAGDEVMVQSTITDSDEGDTLTWDADSSDDADCHRRGQ